LLAPHKELVVQVEKATEAQPASLPRRAIAEKALDHSYALVLAEKAPRFEFCNQYAPEHLILAYAEAAQDIALIRNEGSVFVGPYSSGSLGEYASGTNHTLPTAGFARAYSGVSLASFQKHITFQEAQREGLAQLASTVVNLARAEGLVKEENHRLPRRAKWSHREGCKFCRPKRCWRCGRISQPLCS
jgi:histidinol dehydrogenase